MTKSNNEFRSWSKNELISEVLELRAQIGAQTRVITASLIATTTQKLGLYVCWIVVAFFLSQAVIAMAGKQTLIGIDAGLELDASVAAETTVSIKQLEAIEKEFTKAFIFVVFFGCAGIVYGLRQKKLKEETILQFHPERRRLEEEVDPGRTSSDLTARGTTNPEDKR